MPKPRKRPAKFTTGARVTLAALSLLSFIGGWNLIARQEAPAAQADDPVLPPTPTPGPAPVAPLPTPWPTLPPLADIPPVPTLIPTRTHSSPSGAVRGDVTEKSEATIKSAPLPALAPLPTLAPLPEMPVAPPPPPPAVNFGGGNQSGGS